MKLVARISKTDRDWMWHDNDMYEHLTLCSISHYETNENGYTEPIFRTSILFETPHEMMKRVLQK